MHCRMRSSLASVFQKVALVFTMGLFFISGCGKDDEPTPTPAPAPVASSGRGVLTGVINVASGGCNTSSGVLIEVQSQTGNSLYRFVTPPGTTFEAQLPPGEHTLICQAAPCMFSQRFTIISGQSLVIDPVL